MGGDELGMQAQVVSGESSSCKLPLPRLVFVCTCHPSECERAHTASTPG